MSLSLQNPADPAAPYLLEHVLDACQGAIKGGGAFAFVSAAGVQLLLEDATFSTFLSRGPVDVVLGIDAITKAKALTRLGTVAAANPSLSVQIFLHTRPNALFHPKLCWFSGPKGGTLIAGSGNLTVGGLRGNWEAFTTERLGIAEVRSLEAQWVAWKQKNQSVFRSPTDPLVISEAAKNVGWQSRKRAADGERPEPDAQPLEEGVAGFAPDSLVLVAEIPRAANRWNQANFDKITFEGYFDAKVGAQRRIILRHVDSGGHLGQLESRPGVAVASHNYRFELAAAAGQPYPTSGRPIGVFVKQPSGLIVYRLLLPADPQYSKAAAVLAADWSGSATRMRRVVTTAERLHQFWPEAPFWNLSDGEE